MKRTICWIGIGLFLASLALAGCASTPPVKATVITNSNLSSLKGRWEGWTSFGIGQSRPVLTWVEIINSSVPLQGKITFNQLPETVASAFPADNKTADNSITINLNNGRISDKGTIIDQNGKNIVELTYYDDEKPKLEGWFYYWTAKGTFSVTKK